MLDDKIKQIQLEIKDDQTLSLDEREKLLKLSEELHQELLHLEKTHQKDAFTIAADTHKAVYDTSPEAILSLKDKVREFEVTHPNLTRIVQALCAQFGV